jgi:hypothetical protein
MGLSLWTRKLRERMGGMSATRTNTSDTRYTIQPMIPRKRTTNAAARTTQPCTASGTVWNNFSVG